MSSRTKSREKLLIRQIEGENWEVWSLNGKTRMEEACHDPVDARLHPNSTFALPARHMFAIPLWLATTDEALMRDMIFLQLERRGLAGARSMSDAVFDYRIIKTGENKSLVLVSSLPAALPGSLCLDVAGYEPSPRTLPLPSDEFILWREGDRLVLAITSGKELVYFQALGDADVTENILMELQCIRMQLEAENIINQIQGITLWDEIAPGGKSMLEEGLGLRVRNEPRPAPVLPSEKSNLTPAPVRREQRLRKSRERIKSLLGIVACVYLFFVLVFVCRVGFLYFQVRHLESTLSADAPTVSALENTARRWDSMEDAIQPDNYPVELLLRAARLLPAEGVRFTLFKVTPGKVFIQGEAKNAAAAAKFSEDLKLSKDLANYQWQMPAPKLLPNDNAEFQIEGVRYGAKNN